MDFEALKARLMRLNPSADYLIGRFGKVDVRRVLRADVYDPSKKAAEVRHWLDLEALEAAASDRHGRHAHDVNRHDAHIRSFVVTIAYIKTEAIQAAVFGLIFLGDRLTLPILAAIVIATAGVVLMSFKPGAKVQGGLRPTVIGLFSGAMFALSAVGYRGAILSLGLPNFVLAATFTLAVGLVLQAVLLTLYLALRDRRVLIEIARAWRPSLFAGFMGATASQFWFLAFALTSVANVRTLALIEVLFAQGISYFVFKQATTAREALGMSLIVAGVALLIWVQ